MIKVWQLLLMLVCTACMNQTQNDIDLGPETKSSRLSWASAEEIESGEVVRHSYLIAFKKQASRNGFFFPSSKSKLFFHSRWLEDFASWAAPRYLSSVDLASPGDSFVWKAKMPGSFIERFLWPESNTQTQEAHMVTMQFSSELEARIYIESWFEQGRIWFAEPNFQSKLSAELEDNLIEQFNKPDQFPWLDQVNFIEAMQTTAISGVKDEPIVAVLDSGVDVTHPALVNRMFFNEQGENKLCLNDRNGCNTTANKKDLLGDGNAYPAGTGGYSQPCPTRGQCWHGTHVAGIIAAENTQGYTGVCPYCRILNVKVVTIGFDGGKESFNIQDSAIIAGLAYVSAFTENSQPLVRVVNASFGKFQRSRSVEVFIRALREFGRGILVVAAAGNEDTMKRQYPAAFDDVIGVANVQSDAEFPLKSESSNFGVWVDIAAPGDGQCYESDSDFGVPFTTTGILSAAPGNRSGCLTGTSMASPIVAGVAGLMLAKEPELSYEALRSRLISSARADALYKDGVNNTYRPNIDNQRLIPLLGSGVVNAYYAINPDVDKTPAVVGEKVDLVRPGCAVIGSDLELAGSGWIFLVLLLAPAILVLLPSSKMKRH